MNKAPNEDTASQVLKLWNINSSCRFVRGVENYVYVTEDKTKFLRLTTPSHRSIHEIRSELEWICDLHSHNIEIATPVASQTNQFVHSVEVDDQKFSAVLFNAAQGRAPETRDDYSPKFIENWGQYIGKLHKATQNYKPSEQKRLNWNEEPGFLMAEEALNSKDPCYKAYVVLRDYLHSLPVQSDSFGLIHADLHCGNFFIDQNFKITAFDFDDSQYHWFIYDLAVIMNSIEFICEKNKWSFDYQYYWGIFLKGYEKEFKLDTIWYERVPKFMMWRQTLLYFWIIERFNRKEILLNDVEVVTNLRDRISQVIQSFNLEELR